MIEFNKRIIIERDAIFELNCLLKNNKAIFVSSKSLKLIFKDCLDKLDFKTTIFYDVEDYSLETAYNLSFICTCNHIDLIIAFGGGTINDVCKLSAHYCSKKLVSFPTIVSNDGLCSPISVLQIKNGLTEGIDSKSPDMVIIDTNVIKNAPKKFLKAGICDVLSNFSALQDWELACTRGKESRNDLSKMLSNCAFWNLYNMRMDTEDDIKIKLVCESVILSGISMELKGNTRPCSGAEHLFNHALVSRYPNIQILHGYLVGLGSLCTSYFRNNGYNKILKFLKKYDIDIRPVTLGISKDVFIDCWLNAISTRPNRYTILNEIELNYDLLSELYDKINKEDL